MKGMDIHQQLVDLLTAGQARFRVMEHEAMGKCEAVSEIRGTQLSQGAKALVCKVKGNGVKQVVLAVLGADLQADLSLLAQQVAARKRRSQARRKSMNSPAASSGLSRRSVFTRRSGSSPTRCFSSVTMKSRLTPVCSKNRLSWIPLTICVWRNPRRSRFTARRLPALLKKRTAIISVAAVAKKKVGYPERVGRHQIVHRFSGSCVVIGGCCIHCYRLLIAK